MSRYETDHPVDPDEAARRAGIKPAPLYKLLENVDTDDIEITEIEAYRYGVAVVQTKVPHPITTGDGTRRGLVTFSGHYFPLGNGLEDLKLIAEVLKEAEEKRRTGENAELNEYQ